MSNFIKRVRASPLFTALCLAFFAAAIFIGWKFVFPANDVNRALISLNRAYEKERPFEARISDFAYASFTDTRGAAADATNRIELERAENILLAAAAEKPSAENLHSLGRFYLAKKDFDTAIEQFQKALESAPGDAKIHNDLGAAWLEKGKREDSGVENSKSLAFFAAGLEEFEKALEADKSFNESRFNKALTLQLLNLPNLKQEAWREYLIFDTASPWAREARKNLESIASEKGFNQTKDEMLREFLDVFAAKDDEKAWRMLSRNREMITGKLIPQQLAVLFAETKRREVLDAFIYAGNIEAARTGDSFWKDVAGFYAAASESEISDLNRAQHSVVKGYEVCLKGNYAGGLAEFERARAGFEKSGNILEARLALYWIGYCKYVLLRLTESKTDLETLADFCRTKDYRWLLAHALFWVGVNYGSDNQNAKAIEYYKQAFQASESTSDFYNSQKILTETAEEYRLVGRTELALDYLRKSLALSNFPEASLRQRSRTYDLLVRTFYTVKSYNAALAYEKETVLLLAEIKDAFFHHVSNIRLGQILTAQKKYDGAFEVFAESKRNAEALEDENVRKERTASSNMHIAHLERETGDCGKALVNYDEAIEFFDSSEYKVERYEAHKGRLYCYKAESDWQNFETELETVLEIFEKNRRVILDEQSRNIFFGGEQNIYDIAIGYEYDRGNYEKAFDYSEKSRSRSLLDLLESGAKIQKSDYSAPEIKIINVSEPASLREIKSQMPENVEIVQYTVLSDKTLIWLISKNDFQVAAVPVSENDLRGKVRSFLKLVSTGDESGADEEAKLAVELYAILVSPFIDKTGEGRTIALIPDKSLALLPFASLASPRSGKYFAAEKSFLLAQSANLFIAFTRNAQKLDKSLKTSAENILSVGNPSFDRKAFPDLQNLPAAEREATGIAGFYKNSVVLLGRDAPKKSVKENLKRADVLHFAGHYVVDEHSPLFSSFVLSADTENKDSNLANYELIGEDLSRTRLVVLSACRTGIENFYDGEGMIGASRTFLAAGIPLVVASQWQVDSDATAELMIRFHKYRKTENLSTIEALRRAQLDLINGERFKKPYFWAAFAVLGGYSEF